MNKMVKLLVLMMLLVMVPAIQAMGNVFDSDSDGEVMLPTLHGAVYSGNFVFAVVLVNLGADVNKRDSLGRDACAVAIGRGYFDIAYYLTDVKDFLEACEKGNKKRLVEIVTSGNPHVNINLGLPIAAENDRLEIIDYLVKNGASVGTRDAFGDTMLHIASRKGYDDIVKYLLENGADANEKDRKGRPPIFCTISDDFIDDENYIAIVELLIEYGADITTVYPKGYNILRFAARGGRAGIVEVLLRHGCKVDDQDPIGKQTAMHEAAGFDGGFESVQMLVRYGAALFKKDADGYTPRDLASGTSLVAPYLECVEDFYSVIASKMTFEAFAKKHFETEYVGEMLEYLGNREKIRWIRDILHLADKSFVDKFYEWSSKSELCKKNKFCFDDKPTMYVKICKWAIEFDKNIELWYEFGLDNAPQDMSKKSIKFRETLKRKLDINNPESQPLRKKFCVLPFQLARKALPLAASGFTFKSGMPTDLKITFKK